MPTALHPQAKFDPIPPNLDLHNLVERTQNFQWVLRITAAQIRNIDSQEFEKLVYIHVIHGGKPLVVEKWNDWLPKTLFSAEWLESVYNKKEENVRDIVSQTDIPMTTGHYLRSMKRLTNQWTPTNFRDDRRQRLYLKDIDCPPEWSERLQKVIPPNLFYMNENVDERGPRKSGDDLDLFQDARSATPAGDLMSSLPEPMRAQNLMCYIGHEGTYTPAHREMCASLGQNIMVDASGDENGEKPGSSIWFMTETKDREVVREYFLSMLGHDVEIEKHFAQINAWKKATFPVYIVEQKVGDFILVPPLAPHQVWNRGTRTIKVAWNRTTVKTLEMALHEALPKARLVCRDEQYKNKAIIYFTLEKYYNEMLDMEKTAGIGLLGFGQDLIRNSTRMEQMAGDFKALFRLFAEILISEMFANKEKDVEYIEFDSCVTCSYCRANIFNRFLTCKHCVRQLVNGDEDTYDICMECYAMGRSCLCVSNLSWCEQWQWSDLVDRYEEWRALIIKNDGYVDFDTSPLPLELARKKSGKKSVAQICQEQLRRRPWKDLNKVDEPEQEEISEPEINEEGRPIKKKYRRKKKGDVYRCHVCCHKDYTYKLAFCSNPGCNEAYCYGVLYRAFDMEPQEVMQNERWFCPKCKQICNCGSCRRAGWGTPYIPKNTLLGHDTQPIADDRSVESLVDLRVHNLSWLKNAGDESRSLSSKRMKWLQQAAEAEKAKGSGLDNEVPELPSGEEAARLDAAMQQSIENGYSDQSQVLGYDAASRFEANGSAPYDQQPNGNQQAAKTTDISISQDQSEYPDPSMFASKRMLGMSYYAQDDSPDRILFDPYQIPSAESLVADDKPEMSEYFKKQLRWAKRRARHDDDNDPDFVASNRSHQRKRQRSSNGANHDGQRDGLNNMDPALFGDDTMMDAPTDEDAIPAAQIKPEPERPEEEDQSAPEPVAAVNPQDPGDHDHLPYSPNRPALRHARPKASYCDEDNDEEEFNDIVIPRSQRPSPGITNFNPENIAKDPLDLAEAVIFAMGNGGGVASEKSGSAPASHKKRIGRPPRQSAGRPIGRPRWSEVQAQVTDQPVGETETPEKLAKRRGRPPRSGSRLSNNVGAGDKPDADEENSPEVDLDAQLAKHLDDFDDEGEFIEPAILTPISEDSAPASPRRNRRPPCSAQSQPQASVSKVTVELSTNKPFLSMAERMRLKEKKAKIAERRNPEEASPAMLANESTESQESIESPTTNLPVRKGGPALRGRGSGLRQSVSVEVVADEDFDPNADEEPVSEAASSPPAAQEDDESVYEEPNHPYPPEEQSLPPSPSPLPEQASPSPSPTPSNTASVSIVPPPKAVSSGPTVLRLMDSEDEEEPYGSKKEQLQEAVGEAAVEAEEEQAVREEGGSLWLDMECRDGTRMIGLLIAA
ncbi:hypothetical protein B0T26DRAFT_754245 [Lasiosphaeria miniovina]|uniref:JmjC domain-containing protein n=1 Tax=Lasiosphaeria miniovina TaxID=1954250 RepID=A0AA40A466_9PEZI|nr:uncharacterized protein B0T26DRAFT_754245 [Lasiosphaeria miniovina]KAK0708962.1 hypothetical protein B0T26DRAFT_754245 [Lasiosphaeria miniovina]